MATNQLGREYQQNQINTASPLRLVVLSYEAALGHIASAERAIRSTDIELRSRHINLACSFIANLQGSLDMEKGGEIAASLDRLYDYITRRLCEANLKNDGRPLEECREYLSTLWSAWRQIAGEQASTETAGETAPNTTISLAMKG